jgi:hypothetical protein
MFFQRNRLYIHILDLHVSPGFDCQDYLIYSFFRPLNLHDHTAVPLVPAPAGAIMQGGSMPGTPSETDTLDITIENDVLTNHAAIPF